jgi:dipeptidyl aminopeptidase/acylaminoacyl peptidase
MDKENVSLSTAIGPQEINWESDVLTPEILWSMGRLGEVSVSPDNKQIAYSVSYYSVKQNKGNTAMYIMNSDGSNNKKLTNTDFSEYNIRWSPDSKKIGFLTAESGSMQLWEINPDGTGRKQISNIDGGISGFEYAPDQTKILYSTDLKLTETVKDIYPDLPLSSGRIINDLMYRHWDHWVDTYSHIFIADYDGKSISNSVDIMEGEKWEAPVRPFGGMEQICWSPDSKSIVYSSRKLIGKAYAESTNTDLYQYTIETKKTVNLTEGMMGYDLNAAFSPDGTLLAWESMERDGYEADKNRLFILNLKTGVKEDYTLNFDQDVHGLSWSTDSKKLFFISNHHAEEHIYRLNITSRKIEKITDGTFDYTSVHYAGNFLIGVRQSMSNPSEMFKITLYDYSEIVQLTHINTYVIKNLQLGKVEKRWIPTSDGKEMLTWVIYPPNFDPTKKYPALLYCQGGPQSGVSQFWSYRWNFQIMAANDYIIVAPNRRGVPGFGQEWKEQISGDYGGQNMRDYLAAIDAIAKEDFVDENRLGAVGASYGGFSVYWLAGNHENRFKAFIAHDGMFNLEAQYLETEELFFVEWDLGGPFWDKNNKRAQWSYANSPHKFVQNWNTPILVIHGDKDYRILSSQGFQAYNAALLQGIPAELLFFPDENHWVLKPQNGILWQRRFFNWLDKWLK